MLSEAILPVIASAFFLVGVSILVFLILNIFRAMKVDSRGRRRTFPRLVVDLRRAFVLLTALLLIGTANTTFWVNSQLRLYSPVVPGVPVGTISVFNLKTGSPRLVCTSLDRQGREALEVFPVRDAAFTLEGERIQWAPSLKFLGLDDHFKLSRIEFFPKTPVDSGHSSFAVDVRQGSSDLFRWARDHKKWLPFVQINSVRTPRNDATKEYSRYLYLDSGLIVVR
ncbi:MAG: hypothetical protein HZB43_03885 [candidate division Zixibacteria bacterium]|nr:hypothetical protein [candidate division Zixibacteria bacterium]